MLTVARLRADPARRDDAAHGRGPGDSGLPAVATATSFRRSGRRRSRCTSRIASARSSSRSVVIVNAAYIWRRHRRSPRARRGRPGCSCGASRCRSRSARSSCCSGKQPIINTLHVATGAIVLGDVARAHAARVPGALRGRPVMHVSSSDGDPPSGTHEIRRPSPSACAVAGSRTCSSLAKVRVNALVVATTAGGYYMAAPAIDRSRRRSRWRVVRHGARRGRRRGHQPGARARHRPADGAHAAAAGRRRAHERRPRALHRRGAVASPASLILWLRREPARGGWSRSRRS